MILKLNPNTLGIVLLSSTLIFGCGSNRSVPEPKTARQRR